MAGGSGCRFVSWSQAAEPSATDSFAAEAAWTRAARGGWWWLGRLVVGGGLLSRWLVIADEGW